MINKSFIVHVGEKHIQDNLPQSTRWCAIAKAVEEQFPELGEPNIGAYTAYLGEKHYDMSGNVPAFLYANLEFHAGRQPMPEPIDVEFTERD